MQIRYFSSSWNDIKNSPGWLGRAMRLVLLNFIPIFGQIVTIGYMIGWARDIAWGIHQPMPSRIFENKDGKLYRHGFFGLVIALVFGIVANVPNAISNALIGNDVLGSSVLYDNGAGVSVTSTVSTGAYGAAMVFSLIALVLSLFLLFFQPAACIRMAIYDRLSAGFQLGKLWKMFRRDTNGAIRVIGMVLIAGIVITVVSAIVILLIALIFGLIVATTAGVSGVAETGEVTSGLRSLFAGLGGVGAITTLVALFVIVSFVVLAEMMVYRAVGYWMYQFDVPHWGGQDQPMPFELDGAGAQQGGGGQSR